jgi:hypothetical protein
MRYSLFLESNHLRTAAGVLSTAHEEGLPAPDAVWSKNRIGKAKKRGYVDTGVCTDHQ